MLNARQRTILATLIEQADYVAIADLSRRLGVTPRTVRLDLEAIDEYLRATPYRLERHKHRGARLDIPPEERAEWLARLSPLMDHAYRLSPEERRLAILAALLRRNTPISLGRLADELFVSRRTVVEDVKAAEAWLRDHGLALRRLPSGVAVAGPESAWRRALAEVLAPQGATTGRTPGFPLQPLPPDEMEQIRQAVADAARHLPFELADVAFEGLVYHLAVAVMRLRSGHDIVMDPTQMSELEGRPEWAVASALTRDLQQRFHLRLPRDEVGYITLHLLSAKAIGTRSSHPGDEDRDAPLVAAVDAFIRIAGAHLGTDLTGDDDLVRGLILHLRPAVYRLRYGLRLVNPLKDEILREFPFLVAAVRAAAPALEERLGVRVTVDELTYLAMHVGAHLERQARQLPPRALLVCGSGIGTARLLQSRMQRAFPEVQIVGVVPSARFPADPSLRQADLVISTVPLPPGPKPVVVVNPFLTPEDVRQIRQALPQAGTVTPTERMRGPMLDEVLNDALVRLDVPAADWEEAIRLAGGPLVEAGHVEPRFVDAMVETVRRIGPYIVVDRGVALPHARPEDGVISLGISFVRLREPVAFGHETNDPVKLVFAIASPDAEIHLRALQQLADLLAKPETRAVFEHGSAADILGIVRKTGTEERS
ncbi:BglG family transcription antiterminator [Caldinitratiruptor microaerophilus]|uniref:BglG family transcription antiterminator n=1 Tax=Caldinitratiruptor microaerophilus TaxID=671077 RepID=A0AA35CJP1_9FIRM|nr:PTS sugar transporter subunit IIA [Caldinitratiruptor microaerophilus]BDG59603.1 BglG family transcription antiterminator [Caldinitratiruptor microaerophilus]